MDALNTLDWILLALLAWAAVQGFLRGLVRELAALVAWVLGVWAGLRFSHRAANWLELGPEQEAAGFLVVLLLVLVAVFLLGRLLTRLVDATALSVPNKVLGLVFGVVRKAFVLSVLLNILFATEGAAWTPDRGTRTITDFAAEYGIIFPAHTLLTDIRVSSDGRTIAGSIEGFNFANTFALTIPSPSTAIIAGVALFAANRRRR